MHTKIQFPLWFVLSLAISLTGLQQSALGAVIYGTGNQLNYSQPSSGTFSYASTYTNLGPRVGSASASPNQFTNAIFIFQLPDLGTIDNPFSSVSFSVGFSSYAYQTGTLNADLYGLAAQDTSTLSSTMGYFGSTTDTAAGVTLLQTSFLSSTGNYTANTAIASSAAAITSYLNAQYNGGAGVGDYVFFRVNLRGVLSTASAPRGYNLLGSTAADNLKPSLSYSVIPEPYGAALAAAGITVICALRRRRRHEAR